MSLHPLLLDVRRGSPFWDLGQHFAVRDPKREVPLSINGREALDTLIERTRTDYILPVMTPHSLSRAFSQDKGSVDGSLHSLRHTFGSHLAIKGTPVRVIQELMGHASIRTTEKYLQVAQTHLCQAIDGFSI